MGCTQTKREILRSGSGKIYNRKIKRQKKFRTGLHVEKTSEMGAEANFQAAYTIDEDEVYTRVNGANGKHNNTRSDHTANGNSLNNTRSAHILAVLDVVNDVQQRDPNILESSEIEK